MILTLRIEQLAVVEQAELAFGPGLNVLTGETGAGKSLVLGALALLAGARASADVVREGAEEARVEAVLCTRGLPELEAELAGQGLEPEDGELILRRSISRGGRSRAWVGGAQVPVSSLASLLGGRLEISSQHESQALLRPEMQGRLLDAYAGLLERRRAVETALRALREQQQEIARLRSEGEERARREDFLAFQVAEIDEAGIEPGESERVRGERARLLHAERLREDAALALRCLGGDPGQPDLPGAGDLVAEALRRAESLAAIDASLAPLAERLRGVQAETGDLAADLERYGAAIEADPARLAELEERLARLERLRRKYGGSEEEILVFREQAAAELGSIGGADARLAKLEGEHEAAAAQLAGEAGELSRGRRRAARELAHAVEQALRALAMPDARFEVALEAVTPPEGLPCGPTGAESPEFRFSANAGEPPRSLRRVASGGELSRVFLALKNVLRRADAGSVLVFDEVDAGIGGGVGDRVGAVLAELAESNQVLCITHLPQIAARGAIHLRVRKLNQDGRSVALVERLSAAERVEEIARMAGGESVSEATRRHARALLAAARPPASG